MARSFQKIHTREVTQNGEQNVQPKVASAADLDQNGNRRKDESKQKQENITAVHSCGCKVLRVR